MSTIFSIFVNFLSNTRRLFPHFTETGIFSILSAFFLFLNLPVATDSDLLFIPVSPILNSRMSRMMIYPTKLKK